MLKISADRAVLISFFQVSPIGDLHILFIVTYSRCFLKGVNEESKYLRQKAMHSVVLRSFKIIVKKWIENCFQYCSESFRHVYINSSLMRRNIARSDAQHSTINFNSYTNMFEFFHHLWKKRRAIKKNRPTKGNSQMKHRLPVFFFFSLRFWVGSLASTLIYVHHEVFRYKENISLNFSCGDAVY